MPLCFEDESTDTFLRRVTAWVKQHPEKAPSVVNACQLGITQALDESNQRASDMESALAQALYPGLPNKKKHENIREWILKWRGKSSIRWDWYLEQHNS